MIIINDIPSQPQGYQASILALFVFVLAKVPCHIVCSYAFCKSLS